MIRRRDEAKRLHFKCHGMPNRHKSINFGRESNSRTYDTEDTLHIGEANGLMAIKIYICFENYR